MVTAGTVEVASDAVLYRTFQQFQKKFWSKNVFFEKYFVELVLQDLAAYLESLDLPTLQFPGRKLGQSCLPSLLT